MSKEKLPYFKWYPKDCDINENVRAMDDRELGFYMRCLNHSWVNGSLPADPGELARVMKCTRGYLSRVWPRVARCFERGGDASRLVNGRQEKERLKAIEKSDKCSDAVRTRYARSTDDLPRALARSGSGSSNGSVVVVPEQEELRNNFLAFVELWRKPCECCQMVFGCRDTDQACKQWLSLIDSGVISATAYPLILEGLARWRASADWHKKSGEYVPSVAAWLGWSREGRLSEPRWNDHPRPFKTNSGGY